MKSSNSFQAVYYNEQKVMEQKAELLAAVNFEGSLTAADFLSKNDYIRYFNEVSNLNPRVSRKQFHAVISTKGNAHTPEELKTIAEEYLKRMGYSDNPYLLYFHQDTDNNHVHIVSTRVNTEGLKINDSFEKKESLRHIQNIMEQIPRWELDGKNIADEVMQYQFLTEAQLKLLIEQRGYAVGTDENRHLKIMKDKRIVAKIDCKDISDKLKSYRDTIDRRRIKELKALIKEYNQGNTSHLNTSLTTDIKPIKVSEIIGLHAPILKTSNSADSIGLRLEDIDNSKNVIESSETIEDFYNESFKEFSNLAKIIYKNEEF